MDALEHLESVSFYEGTLEGPVIKLKTVIELKPGMKELELFARDVLSAVPTYVEDYWQMVDYFCSVAYAQLIIDELGSYFVPFESTINNTTERIPVETIMQTFAKARSELKSEAEKDQLLLPLEEV